VDRDLLGKMKSSLSHRGPDGEGEFVSESVGLGHRRLSIIDIDGGAQPVANEDQQLQVVFNGEIYNFVELREDLEARGHVFRTRSDTEVIVHAYEEWGSDCVGRFNGMFAFALWDSPRKRLFIARDHLGVKPLYYVRLGSRFLFASEIKALLTDPGCRREVDLSALSQLFTLRYVPSPNTLFNGIKKLPPAHRMTVEAGGISIERFWNWKPRIRTGVKEDELIEEYRWLVEDTVRLQMRSDVPVGLFLSSGIDSSALLALMRSQSNGPVRTFTIGFEQGEKTNETDDARGIAQRFGADHSEMMVSPKDYLDYYERYIWDLEEPVGNETAAAFYFVSLIASRSVKVALTGQGVDEPWAGYSRHVGVKLSSLYSRLPSVITDGLVSPIIRSLPRNERLKRGAVALNETDQLKRFIKVYSFYNSEMKAKLFQPWLKEQISPNGGEARKALTRLYDDVEDLDPLTQMLYIDTRASLPDDLLMVGDKTAMTNSLEARVPYLDYRLVEFIETLPPGLKLRGLEAKYLHKKAVEKWLPKQMIYKKKKGFDNPIRQWLRGRMRAYVNECLLSEGSSVKRYFSPEYIREIVTKHEQGQEDYLRQIYLLISFEQWHQKFIGN
jgi:asparagine synthase (glutamine-hydrolysing)